MAARVSAPRKVAIIGLGKLGAPMAAAVASRGIQVIGADLDPSKVEAINRGEAPVRETNLAETIRAGHARLRATTDIRRAALEAEVIFIIVPRCATSYPRWTRWARPSGRRPSGAWS